MTIEELLKPRYKVVADFPESCLEVGEILIVGENSDFMEPVEWWDKYPHLFQKLEWWEERHHSELPDYLKVTSGDFTDDYNKIGKVDFYKRNNACIKFKSNNMSYRPIKDTIPATKDEFETA